MYDQRSYMPLRGQHPMDFRGPPPAAAAASGGFNHFIADYERMLDELGGFPDKNHITACTVLAGDHVAEARAVLDVLLNKFTSAPLDCQLPLLYVWDSILFNIGGPFVAASVPELEPAFMFVYVRQDERTRRRMCHVFNKWRQRGTFGPRVLGLLQAKMSHHDRQMLLQKRQPAMPTPQPHYYSAPPPHQAQQQPLPPHHYPQNGLIPSHHSIPHPHGGIPPHPDTRMPLRLDREPDMQPYTGGGMQLHPRPPLDGGYPAGMPPIAPGLSNLIHQVVDSPAAPQANTERPPSPPAEFEYMAVVQQLYSPGLIAADGYRFANRESMEAHNAWFMREKEREEKRESGHVSRPWWVSAVEWVKLAHSGGSGPDSERPTTVPEPQSPQSGEDRDDDSPASPRTPGGTLAKHVVGEPVTDSGDAASCAICGEMFQTAKSLEEDCWVYVDSVRAGRGHPHEGKLVHRYCVNDGGVGSSASSPASNDYGDERAVNNPTKRARFDE